MGLKGFDRLHEMIHHAGTLLPTEHKQITDKVVSIHPAAIAALSARKVAA